MHKRSLLSIAGAVLAVLVGLSVTSASAAAPDPSPPAVPHSDAVALAAPSFQPAHEDVFVPVQPCKILDTRYAGAGPFGNLTTRSFYVTGTFGFAPQGGTSGGCGIPAGATAVSATLVSVNPTTVGYFRAYPTGTAEPPATLLTYSNVGISTGATLTLASSAKPLTVRNHGGPSDLVINVTGYYAKQLGVMISPSGTLYSGSSRAIAASRLSAGNYLVTFDRNIEFCSATASVYATNYYASTSTYYSSPYTQVLVRVYSSGGLAADQYVYLNVLC